MCRRIFQAMVDNARDIPPLFQDVVHWFRAHQRKRAAPDVADAASGAVLFVALHGNGFRMAAKLGFCDAKDQEVVGPAIESVTECLRRICT